VAIRRDATAAQIRLTNTRYRIIIEGHLEKLISLPIADCPGVNVYESEREQTGIIRRQSCGARSVAAIFRGALKAFALHSVAAGKSSGNRPSNHDLRGWHDVALEYGLPDDPSVAENIDALSKLHLARYTRYPQEQAHPPATKNIAESG